MTKNAQIIMAIVAAVLVATGVYFATNKKAAEVAPVAQPSAQEAANTAAMNPVTGQTVVDKMPQTNPFQTQVNPYDAYKNPFNQ